MTAIVIKSAKVKAPTKADRARAAMTKANAKASKALPGLSFDDLASKLVTASASNDGAARVMAFKMNSDFAEHMAAFHCHWSAFTPANCRTDNEKAVLAAVTERKKAVKALAETRGLANPDKPWSDMKRIAVDLFHGGRKPERIAKPVEMIQRELLTKLYKACMKEERPTETECDVNTAIGELLIAYFKVDLSTLG